MNILIICTFFPPDSSIAAVRPYMLAKYLRKLGHNVLVLRSGEFNREPDEGLPALENVPVYSFLGADSDANQYYLGTYKQKQQKKKMEWLPNIIRHMLSNGYYFFFQPIVAFKRIKKAKLNYKFQEKKINSLLDQSFDVVFSTYADLENIWAGDYAARKFNAKWIQDFRDPVIEYPRWKSLVWNFLAKKSQEFALENADLCTFVSDGLRHQISGINRNNAKTLNNGYDPDQVDDNQPIFKNNPSHALKICYTGQIYNAQLRALQILLECFQILNRNKRVPKDGLCFCYAGPNSERVEELFLKYGMSNILENHAYVDRNTAGMIQKESDLFLVLSWNTKQSRGVLTGKFYEGVRAKKPILSIVAGRIPNSELRILNEKYHYGYCAEETDNISINGLIDFIANLYHEKRVNRKIEWDTNSQLMNLFRYDSLAKRLEGYIKELK